MEKIRQVETEGITEKDLSEAMNEAAIEFLRENRETLIKRAHAILRKKFRTGKKV